MPRLLFTKNISVRRYVLTSVMTCENSYLSCMDDIWIAWKHEIGRDPSSRYWIITISRSSHIMMYRGKLMKLWASRINCHYI